MKKPIIIVIITAIGLVAIVSLALDSSASALTLMEGVNAAHGKNTPTTLFGNGGVITTITNVLLFVAGALAVIMLIYGGLRYTTSGGNSANVTAAKNTVLYAIVGLIVAFLAFAIVNFILGSVSGATGQAGFSTL